MKIPIVMHNHEASRVKLLRELFVWLTFQLFMESLPYHFLFLKINVLVSLLLKTKIGKYSWSIGTHSMWSNKKFLCRAKIWKALYLQVLRLFCFSLAITPPWPQVLYALFPLPLLFKWMRESWITELWLFNYVDTTACNRTLESEFSFDVRVLHTTYSSTDEKSDIWKLNYPKRHSY